MAVFPPEDAQHHLKRRLPSGGRHIRPEKWHLTLMFLGDIAEERIGDVTRALAAVPLPRPLSLRLSGGGRFGAVVWAGLTGDVAALAAFREQLRSALAVAGFPGDERPFRPHLTVSYRFQRATWESLQGYAGPSWPVAEFVLVNSVDGEYQRLAGFGTDPVEPQP